ncbi:MAG: helix-turn-helix transcriptional regulator [Fusobacterium sp.]|uniref:helix-turn-helix domain-containing protein n=1 Tax=Fusobacterium sp. TaxID=68766 RepID=UPI0026DA7E45|nr:helix-turn-helix transcriptional regulator [Fusobacterium sp.]MDO4690429.1 helix-turn-helix transcriptional regulator [Fusobacterium sp.]
MLKIKIGYLMVDHKIKSIAELSRKTGINKNTLKKLIDNDRPETLTFENILKLCDFFNCRLSDLIEYYPEEKNSEEQS